VLRAVERGDEQSSIAASLESDTGLLVAALRSTNRSDQFERSVASAPKAVEVLGPRGLRALAESWPTIDPLDGSARSVLIGMRLRAHALTVGMLAERLGQEIGYPDCDELVTSALLHDVGKLALIRGMADADLTSFNENATAERERSGIDHARIGGMLARMWKLPERLAQAIECHHDAEVDGQSAVVLLADQLTHFSLGHRCDLGTIVSLSERVELDRSVLGDLLYELPNPVMAQRRQVRGGTPLSGREADVLKLLAQGKLYKEIAADLDVSASTVRSHLHRIYHRIGAKDRAQAVLIAVERNWI
jgi:putative nucleotidyltransferase with HDIG domain